MVRTGDEQSSWKEGRNLRVCAERESGVVEPSPLLSSNPAVHQTSMRVGMRRHLSSTERMATL